MQLKAGKQRAKRYIKKTYEPENDNEERRVYWELKTIIYIPKYSRNTIRPLKLSNNEMVSNQKEKWTLLRKQYASAWSNPSTHFRNYKNIRYKKYLT